MAFRPENLKNIVSAGTNSAWYYASAEDAVATVVASGYFSAATSKLRTQDTILISATDGAGLRRVSSVTGATPVTVTTGS